MRVHYDRRFEPVDEERSRLTWIVVADGLGAATLGRLFGALYARKLDRAIPAQSPVCDPTPGRVVGRDAHDTEIRLKIFHRNHRYQSCADARM